MRCECGHNRFYARQLLRADIIVDSNGEFAANIHDDLAANVYEAERPYGPYQCELCGREYEELTSCSKT